MGTKGTWKRPAQVSEAEAQANWDRIFGGPVHPEDDQWWCDFPRPLLRPALPPPVQIAEPPATE